MARKALDNHREIIENPRFVEERNALDPNVRRMDEILRGVCGVLSKNPRLGKETANPRIWAMPTEEYDTAPLVVYYSFNEQCVWLESLVRAEDVG